MKLSQNIGQLGYAVRLCKYIKGIWGYMLLSLLCTLLFKLMPILISMVTAYMISAASLHGAGYIWSLFLTIVIMVLLSGVLSYLDIFVSHETTYRILTRFRNIAYDKVDELAPAAMESRHSGEITSIVLEDVEQLEWFYAHTVGQLVIAIVIPVAALILLGTISPFLILTIIPFIVLMVCVPIITSKKANTQGVTVRTAFAEVNAQVVDGTQGLKDIISFGWQQPFFQRITKSLNQHRDAQIAYAERSGEETRRFQLVVGIGSLFGQATAAALTISGTIDVVWLIPVFVLCSAIFSPIQEALTMSTNYGLIFGAAKRLFELFQMKPTVKDIRKTQMDTVLQRSPGAAVTISFEHVAFTYPSEKEKMRLPLIKDLSFEIRAGETVALVGASGSGKTTATRLLQRFWDVDSGCIRMNGIDIRDIQLEALRDIITVVPQETYLFNMSVADNLRLAKAEATAADIETAAKDAQADGFIRKLPQNYDTILGERGMRLSGGEKQRISIAQAFLKNSPVLVLDEASANLDSETERQINSAVNKLKRGRTTLVIAHRISTIRSADRIVVIRDGAIEGTGTYDELIISCPYFLNLIGGDEYKE